MLVSGANQLYPNIKYKLKKIKFRTAKKYHQQWNILSFMCTEEPTIRYLLSINMSQLHKNVK